MKSDTMKAQSESKWTAGPWIDDGHDSKTSIIVSSKWGEVCRVVDNGDATQRDANARLISQAPEMIQALEEALLLPLMSEHEMENWGNKCAGIIARAKGEKP